MGALRASKTLARFVEPVGFIHNTPILINKKAPIRGLFIDMAERVGFEPTKGY